MKNNPQKTVLLGLSGGVDSSVAALLLKKQGYKVIGAFMKNFSDTKNKFGECAWRDELRFAERIAAILNIPLLILDFEKQYKKYVIDTMFKDYKKGLTPNPDILCNKIIKFPLLWKKAKEIGADYIATGHYARIKKTNQGYQLLEGKDKTKDQSYFLSELSQRDLEHTLFPIGNFKKEQVRQIAKQNNFPNFDKQGSRGICFVGKVNLKSFLENKIKNKPGKVLDPNSNQIGTHPGTFYYTIGQRIGSHTGIIISKPAGKEQEKWYVADKNTKSNIIIAAPEHHPLLKRKQVTILNIHQINPKQHLPSSGLKARIRHLGELHSGKLICCSTANEVKQHLLRATSRDKQGGRLGAGWRDITSGVASRTKRAKNNKYNFIFSKPIEAIAEGQSIVLYKNQQLIASGEIRIKNHISNESNKKIKKEMYSSY